MSRDRNYEGIMPSEVFDQGILSTTKSIWPTNVEDVTTYPDTSSSIPDQLSGLLPRNHGFPMNPIEVLESKLDEIERLEREAEELALSQGIDPEPKAFKEEKIDGEDETERPLTLEELVSPLSVKEIREQRNKNNEKKKTVTPKLEPEVHIFIFGGHDYQKRDKKSAGASKPWGLDAIANDSSFDDATSSRSVYDDTEDKEKYNAIMKDIFEGRTLLLLEKVEDVHGTTKFKVFLKVARYVE